MYLAVDIGGTKTLLGVFTKDGVLKESFRFQTPKNYSGFLSVFRRHVEPLLTQNIQAVCVGAPGLINYKTGVASNFGNLPWKNVPIQKDIEHIVSAPTLIDNDANLAGLGEARNVKGDYKKVLFVTIGTGIGTGIITDGVIDPQFRDSEGGHMPLEHNGKIVKWESFASGKAIEQQFNKQARQISDQKTWQIISHNIAVGLIDLIAVVQPDLIIIGGGVGSHFDQFGKLLKTELKKYETPMTQIPPIQAAKRPEEAVLFGCYEQIRDTYGSR